MTGTTLIRSLLVALLGVLGVLVAPGTGFACDCPEPPPPSDAVVEADAVFAGEVVAITEGGDGPPGPWRQVRVEVSDVWKGEVHEVEAVRTHADEATCGYGFVEGRTELVYAAVGDDGQPTTGLCSRTTPLADADEDLAALGQGNTPRAGTGPGVDQDAGPGVAAWPTAAAGVAAVVGLAALWLWVRRR